MTFSAEWLALREPADHAALNPEVRAALAARFAGQDTVNVVDLGSGAGSNLRGTWSVLPDDQTWTLVDYDPALLDAARLRLAQWADSAQARGEGIELTKQGKKLRVFFREADLSGGNFSDVVVGAELITAAALFDLVSIESIERLAESVVHNRQVFFTVLTYDGHSRWTPPHAADSDMCAAFNTHQRGDKGFGPAAGPGGTTALAKAFYSRGYRVLRGTSPWVVDRSFGSLRRDLDTGFAGAVSETGAVDAAVVEDWLKLRRASKAGVTVIGHEDLLAMG